MKKAKLFKQTAVLTTGVIEVQVLTLEKRKLTMGVFRQIPTAPVFQTLTKRQRKFRIRKGATLWGIVRYTWTKSPAWAECYVVWELDGRLHKTPLPETLPTLDVWERDDEKKDMRLTRTHLEIHAQTGILAGIVEHASLMPAALTQLDQLYIAS